MNGETVISWNFTNWVTVVLMVAVGLSVLWLVSQGIRKVIPATSAATPQGMANAPAV